MELINCYNRIQHDWPETRQQCLEMDHDVICDILKMQPQLAPLFLCGEAAVEALPDDALAICTTWNEVYANHQTPPLFYAPNYVNNIQLTRWSGEIKYLMSDELWNETALKAIERLRLPEKKYIPVRTDNFYKAAVLMNTPELHFVRYKIEANKGIFRTDQAYMNMVLMFGKAGLFNVQPNTFCSRFSFDDYRFFKLSQNEEREMLRIAGEHDSYPEPSEGEYDFTHYLWC